MANDNSDDLISRHIFLFPFKWENAADDKDGFAERTSLSKFHDILLNGALSKAAGKGLKWERQLFQIEHLNQFNEFNYFYDYVREILYDLGEEGENETSPLFAKSAGKSLLRHYELNLPEEKLTYCIEIDGGKVFHLDIDSVMLNVYETGVGVLVFFLGNRDPKQNDPEDILLINQFGRRIMPPFLGIDPKNVGKNFDFGNSSDELKAALLRTQSAELAKSISIQPKDSIGEGWAEFREDFSDFQEIATFQKGTLILPKFISSLFPEGSIETFEPNWDKDNPSNKILLKPVLDDRMFVLCWYGGKDIVKAEFEQKQREEAEKLGFEPNPDLLPGPDFLKTSTIPGSFWYRFTFVDGKNMSIYNSTMADDLIRKHTYPRWIPYTYYGISRYSLVCLTSSLETLRQPFVNAAFLPQHIESIYYKLFELAIVQRASVLRFADEVTHLSHFHVDKKENAEETYTNLAARVKDLYQHYIQFVNKIYFREVTAQEQGIEMYDMLQKHLRIETQVEDLDKEIEELHSYVKMLEEEIRVKREQEKLEEEKKKAEYDKKLADDRKAEEIRIEKEQKERDKITQDKLNLLTIIGAIFVLPSFILSIYGLDVYNNHLSCASDWLIIPFVILMGILGFFSYKWANIDFSDQENIPKDTQNNSSAQSNHKTSWLIAIGITIFIMLAGPFVLENCDKKSESETKEQTIHSDENFSGNVTIVDSLKPDTIQINDTENQPIDTP